MMVVNMADYYSDHDLLLRKTMLVMEILSVWKIKALQKKSAMLDVNKVSHHKNRARLYWIKQAQYSNFAEEIKNLKRGQDIPRHSKLLPLNPQLDKEGVLRVHGRLVEAPLLEFERFPIILPKGHGFVTSLILKIQGELATNESELVVDHVRQNMREVEKMLTRRKELILREEEKEVQQPKQTFSALDRLNQREHFHFELPERERSPRALPRDWDEPGTLQSHKKIVLAWCIGSAIFASTLGFIVVMWSKCWSCCRKRAKKPTPVDASVEPLELEPLK